MIGALINQGRYFMLNRLYFNPDQPLDTKQLRTTSLCASQKMLNWLWYRLLAQGLILWTSYRSSNMSQNGGQLELNAFGCRHLKFFT